MVYHVLNRGNGRMRIFHKGEDFEAFATWKRMPYVPVWWQGRRTGNGSAFGGGHTVRPNCP